MFKTSTKFESLSTDFHRIVVFIMLPLRSVARIRQGTFCATSIPPLHKKHLSISRQLLQDQPKPQSKLFVPAPPPGTRPSFKDSPVSPRADREIYTSKVKATPYGARLEARVLPQTGRFSGRTVECKNGGLRMALVKLNRIARDNNIRGEALKARVRYKPSVARQRLRSKRHRIRFKQGVARLAEIVLRMRKKSY